MILVGMDNYVDSDHCAQYGKANDLEVEIWK
jgi:hypothetical protein